MMNTTPANRSESGTPAILALRMAWRRFSRILPPDFKRSIRESRPVRRLIESLPGSPDTLDMEIDFWKQYLGPRLAQGVVTESTENAALMEIGGFRDEGSFAGKVVVDIGCGPCGSLCWMKSAKARIGVDPLAERYAEFGVNRHNMVYVAAPAERIPLISDSADLVTSFYALHYARDIRKAWAEIRRIIKPGGCFIGAMNMVREASRREPSAITLELARTHFFRGWQVEFEKVIAEGQSFGDAYTYKFLWENPPADYRPQYHILCCRIRKPESK